MAVSRAEAEILSTSRTPRRIGNHLSWPDLFVKTFPNAVLSTPATPYRLAKRPYGQSNGWTNLRCGSVARWPSAPTTGR
jgi:hypothetical protein